MAPGAIDASIPNDAYIPAMLDTPSDPDGFVRKMRVSYRFKGQSYYSMAVTAASAFLGKDPSVTASSIRTSIIQKRAGDIVYEDNFFYINYKYSLSQRDTSVKIVSFYDVLHHMDALKAQWGEDFLKDSLVIVFPAAAVLQDFHLTPLGYMPGGFLHINGIINILTESTVTSPWYLTLILIILSFLALLFVIHSNDLKIGLVGFAAVLFFNFICAILLWGVNIKIDLYQALVFSSVFLSVLLLINQLYFLHIYPQ